jgi:hypothetical protein
MTLNRTALGMVLALLITPVVAANLSAQQQRGK